jgi:hypothetical protein
MIEFPVDRIYNSTLYYNIDYNINNVLAVIFLTIDQD